MQRIRTNVKKHILFFILFIAIIAADQISKRIIANTKPQLTLIKGLLSFHYTENTGAAFSFLDGKSWAHTFFITVTIISIFVFFFFYFKINSSYKTLKVAIVLISAGAIGNFIDRLMYKYVVDFISLHFFPAIFNVADIALTVGAVLFVYHFLFLDKDAIIKRKKNQENE